jgi:hypothetical protein
MRIKSRLYTFVLEYAGGTYVSQYAGRNHVAAFQAWVNAEPSRIEKHSRVRLAKGLAKGYVASDASLTPLMGLVNVWCWSAHLPRGLALGNVVMTSRR